MLWKDAPGFFEQLYLRLPPPRPVIYKVTQVRIVIELIQDNQFKDEFAGDQDRDPRRSNRYKADGMPGAS
jgi:hypothetical protein